MIYDVIQDGYGRDPDRSFVLFRDHLDRNKGADLPWERFGEWGYEIGKCSQNLERDLLAYLTMRGSLFGNMTDDSPFEFDQENQDLAGLVDREEGAARNILDEWSKRDLEGATEWYLSQGVVGQSREEQIWTAAYYWEFDGESGLFAPSGEEIESVFQFLEQQKANGEPVDYAQDELVDMARRMENWDVLLKVEEKVSPAIWNRVLSGVKEEIVGRESIELKGGEALKFLAISEEDTAVLERFGMRDEAIEEVARTNEASLKELQKRLGVE